MRRPLNEILRYLHRAAGMSQADVVTDGQLLERFAGNKDDSALELLVRRHVGLVWGVCRRHLGDTPDAEDALQATFLVLIRKAAQLERRPSLSSWLYGVAFRVSQKARVRSARRQQREGGGCDLVEVAEPSQANPELRATLDAEIERLPERYRAPLVLCYFEGKTNAEAARELGCSAGLVAKYLARGRLRLRERLRHPSLAATAGLLSTALAEAVPPPALVEAAIQSALSFAGSQAASGGALDLAEAVMHAMCPNKLKYAALLTAGCFLVAGTGWLALAATHHQETPPAAPALSAAADPPRLTEQPLTPERAARLQKMILPQPGENPFWQVAWQEDVWEARQQAAAQGKPLFVWGGSEGPPITNCSISTAAGRAPAIWSDETIRLLRQHFVAVSLDVMAHAKRRDAVGDFLRDSGCVRFVATGHVSAVTPDGITLGIVNPTSYREKGLHGWLAQRLADWQALPEERRRPGAVEVGPLTDVDPIFAALKPPEGALILRVTNRTMQQDRDGQFRYLGADDFETKPSDIHLDRYRDPANDFMWIQKAEWRAMIPPEPKVGQSQPAPAAVQLRLFAYHLNPNLGIQGSRAFAPRSLKAGELTVQVEAVTDQSIRLRLEGRALLDAPGGLETRLVYRPELLGHMTYDRQKDAVTALDLAAFGELRGRLHRAPETLFSEAPRYLGVAFELIPNPVGAEKLRPNAARLTGADPLSGLQRYLNPRYGGD